MTSEWTDELQELYRAVQQLQLKYASFNYKMQGYAKNFSQDEVSQFPEICDLGFLYRELGDLFKELSTTSNAWEAKLSNILCLGMMYQQVKDPTKAPENIRGTLATGTPKILTQPKFPKKDTPEFLMLMKHMGVPLENANLFSPSFKTFEEHLTKLAEEGKPMPPGIVGKYEVNTMLYRRMSERSNE